MPSQSRSIVDVGLGAVVAEGPSREPRLLITRRPGDRVYAGYWELPGGKCEAGEGPEACVVRELAEEVGLTVTPVRALTLVEHVYEHAHVRLHPWLCEPRGPGEAQPIEVAELRWVSPAALGDYAFPEANRGILAELAPLLRAWGTGHEDEGGAHGGADEQ